MSSHLLALGSRFESKWRFNDGSGDDLLIGNRGNDTIIGGQPAASVSGEIDEIPIGDTEGIYANMSAANATG